MNKNKLFIIGLGTQALAEITLRGFEKLKEVDHIAFIDVHPDDMFSFNNYYQIGASVTNLTGLYLEKSVDTENYVRISKKIISLTKQYKSVAFVMAGHPRLGVILTKLVEGYFERHPGEISIDVIPGISSFDAMVNVTKCDILDKGTQIIDINRALIYDYKLCPYLDTYIYHICAVLNPITNRSHPWVGNRLDLLKNYLLRFYPPNHPCSVIEATRVGDQEDFVRTATIESFFELQKDITYSRSLFIPGLPAPEKNEDMLNIALSRLEDGY